MIEAEPQAVHVANCPYGPSYFGWYGLAWAGGTIAYQPFLSFLLPLKIIAMGGRPDPVLLSTAVLLGGVTAGLANLGWGIAGDYAVVRGASRRNWILAGVIGTMASYVMLAFAHSASQLIGALLCFQIALNLILSALGATAADEVMDRDKGLLGGVLCIGAPAGAAASVVATLPGISLRAGLLWIAFLIPVLVLPFALQRVRQSGRSTVPHRVARSQEIHEFALLWSVRLVLQVATKAIFFFLMYYFTETVGRVGPAAVARLTLFAAIFAAPAALVLGRWSDHRQMHRPMLVALIGSMATGLVLMAVQTQWAHAVAGYLLFASSAAICLALHAGYSMLQMPEGLSSGKGLGLLNLTNTLPAIIVAGLGVAIVPQHGYRTLCWLLAVALLLAALALTWPRRNRGLALAT